MERPVEPWDISDVPWFISESIDITCANDKNVTMAFFVHHAV